MATLSSKTGLPSFASSASGAGRVNYFSNSGFEIDTTGVTTYANAAAVTPSTGTGGSPTITAARSTSGPLNGTASLLITKPASNVQGQGVALSCTVPTGYASGRKNEFTLLIDTNVTGYTAGDLRLYIYDVTNSTLITPSVADVPKITGPWQVSWDSSSTSVNYRAILHFAGTTASAYSVKVDDVVVGPGQLVQGAAVSNPESWTPTGSWTTGTGAGPGNSATYTGRKWRVGSLGHYEVKIVLTGTPTAANLTINMPTGETFDTTALLSQYASAQLGQGTARDAGVSAYPVTIGYNNATSVIVFSQSASPLTNTASVNASGPFAFNTSDEIYLRWSAPIAEWASSGVNLGAGAQVEYLSTVFSSYVPDRSSRGTALPTTTPTGTAEEISATSSPWQYPQQSSDVLKIEIDIAGNNKWGSLGNSYVDALRYDGTNYIGLGFYYHADGSLRFYRGRFATGTSTAWSTLPAGTRFRLVKANPSAPVGFGLASGTASGLLNYYQEDDTTLAACTFKGNLGGANSAGVAIRITRVGRTVTLDIPSFGAVVPTTNSTYLLSNTLLPSWARPYATRSGFHQVYNNGAFIASAVGAWNISTGGEIQFYRDLANTAYTNSANAGWYHTQITYTV